MRKYKLPPVSIAFVLFVQGDRRCHSLLEWNVRFTTAIGSKIVSVTLRYPFTENSVLLLYLKIDIQLTSNPIICFSSVV